MNQTPAIFANDQHRELYSSTLDRMKSADCYHRAAAYLLSLDNVLWDHMALYSKTPELNEVQLRLHQYIDFISIRDNIWSLYKP